MSSTPAWTSESSGLPTVGLPRGRGRLVAIDYPHDLAILKSGEEGTPLSVPTLDLSEPPAPGDEVLMCGYPFGVETPRLARGAISGYDLHRGPSCSQGIQSVLLDLNVNRGNSGGPVCDHDGRVVGVVCALRPQPLFLSESARTLEIEQPKMLEVLSEHLNTGTGIGFALNPSDVISILDIVRQLPNRMREPYRRYDPQVVAMKREDFAALQQQWLAAPRRPDGTSSVGVYSFDRTGQYYLGWPDQLRVAVTVGDAWTRIAPLISPDGGSFFLRGFKIHLYRQKYKGGYIVPVRINIIV